MKTLLVLVGLVAVTQAGLITSTRPVSRIINGENAKIGEIPYQVSLQYKENNFHFCGGSIMNKKYVLTAAHCVVSKKADEIQVIAGTVSLDDPVSTYMVKKIVIHAEYNPNDSWRHDIAILLVDRDFIITSTLGIVKLATASEDVPAESVAVVSGWGQTKSNRGSPVHLQKAAIFIDDQEYCEDVYKAGLNRNIYETHICARHPMESTGACNGDSGGPLTANGKQVGIVSWSYGCAHIEYPTVYTRVSSYLDWIIANIE